MISKRKIKRIRSLAFKKYRQKEQLFIVEGDKNVQEVLNSDFCVKELYATESFLSANEEAVKRAESITDLSVAEIKKASLLKQPQNCLAVCSIPTSDIFFTELTSLLFFLDGLQDPGNLGTIIRICDWFGLEQLICSPKTVDVYNPKVIQASMGSFCRVKVIYMPFAGAARLASDSNIPVFGTFKNGRNIYKENLPREALVILGNEGKGISREVAEKIEYALSIPSFRRISEGAESLNVAVAAGIVCSEYRRREL